jgi:hypothetical protein
MKDGCDESGCLLLRCLSGRRAAANLAGRDIVVQLRGLSSYVEIYEFPCIRVESNLILGNAVRGTKRRAIAQAPPPPVFHSHSPSPAKKASKRFSIIITSADTTTTTATPSVYYQEHVRTRSFYIVVWWRRRRRRKCRRKRWPIWKCSQQQRRRRQLLWRCQTERQRQWRWCQSGPGREGR